jgi:hypothetical protein
VPRRRPRSANLGLLRLVQLDVAIALLDRELGARCDPFGITVLEQARVSRQRGQPRAAQQAMQRQAGGLAGDVPERDVEAREGERRDAVATEQVQPLLEVARQPDNVVASRPIASGAIIECSAALTASVQP